jgi:hypothetical protein
MAAPAVPNALANRTDVLRFLIRPIRQSEGLGLGQLERDLAHSKATVFRHAVVTKPSTYRNVVLRQPELVIMWAL